MEGTCLALDLERREMLDGNFGFVCCTRNRMLESMYRVLIMTESRE